MTGADSRTFEGQLGRILARWAVASARYRRGIGLGALLLFLAAIGTTATQLGIRSETEALFPEDLPFRVRDARFLESFPRLQDNIVLVVEGPDAEATRSATLRLANRLAADPSLFPRVYLPADPFFEENGLLYLDIDELDALADRLVRLQPLLAGLIEEENLRGLMDQTRDALEALRRGQIGQIDLAPILGRIENTVHSTLGGGHAGEDSLDWSSIVDWGESRGNPRRRVIHVQPHLDYGNLAAAHEAIRRVRQIGRELEIVPERGYRLRMTGDAVLNFDEMSLLKTQVAGAGVLSFVVVAILLFAALRSARLVLATITSLVFGLGLTAGFATLAIGHLNMISIAFAVLFIGLGVDFGIHLCMRFQELRVSGLGAEGALVESARGVGSSLMLCAITTAVGFFAFIPTEFIGVAELGVIAGVGMFIGVIASFTIIPALLIGDGDEARRQGGVPTLRLPDWPVRWPRAVVLVSVLLGILAFMQLPKLRFDQNPLNVRDPSAESVRVYRDLLTDSDRSPWTLEYLAEDANSAALMAERFAALPEVDRALALADFVPDDQGVKLETIAEIAYFLDWSVLRQAPPSSSAESLRAMVRLRQELEKVSSGDLAEDVSLAAARLEEALGTLLERLDVQTAGEIETTLADLERRLLGNFSDLLSRLERAMRARPVALPDLPVGLRESMLSSSGRHRVQIVPAEDLAIEGALDRFVAAGERISEELAGPAIRIHASARAVVRALEQALTAAIIVILIFLFLLWRELADVLFVMLPLLWAGLMTGASMVGIGIDFNFADVIVIPLLLGIGVDSGIHLVHRFRIRENRSEALLGTSTARAVVFSATTTIASFGTLALVPHRGMASLGQLLMIGVAWTVIANLVLLPALLELRESGR